MIPMSDRLTKLAQLARLCWIGGFVLWVFVYSWIGLWMLGYSRFPDIGVPYFGLLIELAMILAGVSAIGLGKALRS